MSTFINKTPYNEDLELEETHIDQNFLWKDQVTDKFRSLLENIKKIQQDPSVDVSRTFVQEALLKGTYISRRLN